MAALNHPLARYSRFATEDVDEAREQVAKVFCDHRLIPDASVRTIGAWQTMASLGQIAVGAMGYGAEVDIDPGVLEDFYLVMLPYRGQADVRNGRQQTVATPTCGAILNPDDKTTMKWSGDCAKIMVRIERKALEDQLSGMLGGTSVRGLSFDLAIPLSGGDARFWTLARLLVDELEGATDPRHLQSTKLYTSLLLVSLLEHHPHNFSARLGSRTGAIAPRHVRLVEDYVDAHADQDLSLDDLIAVSGVSGRALFEGFRKFRGISPLAHLRLVRMRRVREGLLAARPGETVTDIAAQWGFFQLGRFAAQYRKIFGEHPSETLRNR